MVYGTGDCVAALLPGQRWTLVLSHLTRAEFAAKPLPFNASVSWPFRIPTMRAMGSQIVACCHD